MAKKSHKYMPHPSKRATVVQTGSVTEITVMSKQNTKQTVLKLNKDEMVVLSTGEVVKVNHSKNRLGNMDSIRKTMVKLRRLINNNFWGAPNELMITLTYKENMRDHKRLYADVDKFMKRLRYYFRKCGNIHIEYLVVVEPQERGAWHMHILIKGDKPLFIPNVRIAKIWGHGFTKTKRLEKVDDIGAYLTAYLANLPVDDKAQGDNIITKKVGARGKKYIKGARLYLYPTSMKLYRASRGIKMPEIQHMPYGKALELVEGQCQTYKDDIPIEKENFRSIVHKEFYNAKRPTDKL